MIWTIMAGGVFLKDADSGASGSWSRWTTSLLEAWHFPSRGATEFIARRVGGRAMEFRV